MEIALATTKGTPPARRSALIVETKGRPRRSGTLKLDTGKIAPVAPVTVPVEQVEREVEAAADRAIETAIDAVIPADPADLGYALEAEMTADLTADLPIDRETTTIDPVPAPTPAPTRRYKRRPARQRKGGWGRREWLAWQDRMFPELNAKQRQKLVRKLLKIKSAMYYKMNGGSQFPSERVERLCRLIEINAAVARGDVTKAVVEEAGKLLESRDSHLTVVAYHVWRNWLTTEVKAQAAEAILTEETQEAVKKARQDAARRAAGLPVRDDDDEDDDDEDDDED